LAGEETGAFSVNEREREAIEGRLRLNQQIKENPYWFLPIAEADKFRLETPVGRGVVSSDNCASLHGLSICYLVDRHSIVVKGVDYTGKWVVVLNHWWCHNPKCPKCFIRGWAVREAGCIEERLKVASEHFGAVEYVRVAGSSRKGLVLRGVEHIVASVPSKDYGLCDGHYERLRAKVVKVLASRGVAGGCLVFHGFRYDERDYWYFSPHFHVLGFIFGGFSRCRHCDNCGEDRRSFCRGCDGFKGREVRGSAKDGYVVKVLDKRKKVYAKYRGERKNVVIFLVLLGIS
jgi:hypothetical protein